MNTAGRLNILLLAANPKDLDQLALAKELETITDHMRAPAIAKRVRIDPIWSVTADLLAKTLDAYRPNVLHYAGHGNEKGEPLLLDAATDNSQAAPLRALRTLLRQVPELKCIVFNACYSTRLAQELALDLPVAVVGMRAAVDDDSALAFTDHFYRQIAGGKSLQAAFEAANAILQAKGLFGADLPQMNAHPGLHTDEIVLLPAADTGPGPRPVAAITELTPEKLALLVKSLMAMFSTDELLRFLRFSSSTAAIVDELPDSASPKSKIFGAAGDALVAHGALDDGFFARWIKERPKREAEIRKLQRDLSN